ncbi:MULTISPECIES: S4 domain-containing protein YaaA [unclassified Streptococcus]|uniref:S4 domain-containing protein YaaA n=1 Tax=unclassified Streptococcus TaxID=2608887 RepID=UPI0010719571|nr:MULTISPECIES: S4 domain-containing protein YaaA [unclassified Streptococcus]MBF0806583.1 S4 domain-containing protein YaaA [Streptococcus sp. 19428wA2_WM07]TFU27340.1 S4 domain-containing protein YaaA [Streptococcus sp. WM07]
MNYKLFDDFITLQALLKDLGIIQSGGAVKAFLAEKTVLLNGQEENRRGKKLYLNDHVSIPDLDLTIQLQAPSSEELLEHQEAKKEKERIAKLVKELNKKQPSTKPTRDKKKPVRFPGR